MLRIIIAIAVILSAIAPTNAALPPFPWTEYEWDLYGVEYAASQKVKKDDSRRPAKNVRQDKRPAKSKPNKISNQIPKK